jgi:hypothetical protein
VDAAPRTDAAPRPFLAQANVGLFPRLRGKPIVPDVFISLDVEVGPDWTTTHEPRSYFFWEFGKPHCANWASNRMMFEWGVGE